MHRLTGRFGLTLIIYICSCIALTAAPKVTSRYFNVRNGLPSNEVSSVAPDHNGLIWIGTWNGLAFYDGYHFVTYRAGKECGKLSTNRILNIQPDTLGNVWFTTYDHKLNLLNSERGKFVDVSEFAEDAEAERTFAGDRFYHDGRNLWISGYEQSAPYIWKITVPEKRDDDYRMDNIVLSKLIPGSHRLIKASFGQKHSGWLLTDAGVAHPDGSGLLKGSFADICSLGTNDYLAGTDGTIYRGGGSMAKFARVDMGRVCQIIAIDDNSVGVAGTGGMAVVDTRSGSSKAYPVAGGVAELNSDSHGRLWGFSPSGAIVMVDGEGKFSNLGHSPLGGSIFELPMFYEDEYGTVWMAPAFSGLAYYDEKAGRLSPMLISQVVDQKTFAPSFEKFFPDGRGNLWLTSTSGLTLVGLADRAQRSLPLEPGQETRSVLVNKDNSLLAGSVTGVVGQYDTRGNLLGYLSKSGQGDKGTVSLTSSPVKFSERIYALFQDNKENLWIGTKGDGIYIIDKNGNYTHYHRNAVGENHFDCDSIYAFASDSKGRIWIGTYGKGLFRATGSQQAGLKFTNFSAISPSYPKVPAAQYVRRITSDKRGLMVLSTNAGIITFNENFHSPADIQFKTSHHDPGEEPCLHNNNVMQVLISRNGKDAFANVLGGSVQRIDATTLGSDDIKVSDMTNQELQYRYGNILSMAEGADGRIYMVRETDIATYNPATNRIITLGNNLLGGEQEFSEALPAVAPDGKIYFGALGCVVRINPAEIKGDPDKPNVVFTGIRLDDGTERQLVNPSNIELQPDHRNFSISFAAIDYSNGARLEYAYRMDGDTLWNYLGKLNELQVTDLTPGIHRLFVRSTNGDGTWVDNEKYVDIMVHPTFWETVWAKLLIFIIVCAVIFFAVHYYIVNHRQHLMAQMRRREHDFYMNASHKLRTPLALIGSPVYEVLKHETLSDTGRRHLEKVRRSAKDMLKMLNELIEKEFRPDIVSEADLGDTLTRDRGYMDSKTWLEVPEEANSDKREDIKILIVEDNKDLLEFLRDILSPKYQVITATNGQEGLEKAEAEMPDFILTDLNMPVMNGMEMISRIKQSKQLAHIPIIVLSAQTDVECRVEGLRAGIDDYITKPFSATYLRMRIANIIEKRNMLQQFFFEQLGKDMMQSGTPEAGDSASDADSGEPHQQYRLESPQIVEADQLMMEKLMKFLEERIGDEGLRIEEMAEAVSMGRTVFYGKIKAIVGMSPSDFLRKLRMQRAEDLIVKSRMNFSQIAFAVGFSDPKYFTKCFKKETGMTPSEYRHKNSVSDDPATPGSTPDDGAQDEDSSDNGSPSRDAGSDEE